MKPFRSLQKKFFIFDHVTGVLSCGKTMYVTKKHDILLFEREKGTKKEKISPPCGFCHRCRCQVVFGVIFENRLCGRKILLYCNIDCIDRKVGRVDWKVVRYRWKVGRKIDLVSVVDGYECDFISRAVFVRARAVWKIEENPNP